MPVSADLKNSNFTPTSELQDSYNDLRKFLALRTSEELLSLSRDASVEQRQLADNLSNKTLAISSLLSPDGAFFTKDVPLILKNNLNLKADDVNSSTRGDINVYGAGDSNYGTNLFEAVGIRKVNFNLKSSETAQALSADSTTKRAEADVLYEESITLTKQISSKREELKKPNLSNDQKTALEKEIKDLTTRRDEIDTKANALTSNAISSSARSRALKQETETKSALSSNINVSPDFVDAINNSHVSLYRHTSQYSDPSSLASDYCNVFFNAIDSINMSLCVPYFRMNIIDRFAKKKGRYSKLSLAAFLKQSQDTTGDKIFYEAEPFITNTSRSIKKKLKSGKVVGMETFFAPQTLLPDPTEILDNPRRLDTSVPLLSLNSFSIGIETVGIALLSKKTADLSITLHDRSRLSDISPLVSVGNFSSLYFEIEWGWTHPHGEAQFDNPVARYLNSLRFREIFAPTSYNMTMAENGAMNISIRLIGGSSIDAVNGSVLNGGFLTRSYTSQILDKLIKSEIREESGEEKATEEVRAVTQVLIDKSRTADMVDSSFLGEIWKYVNNVDRSNDDRKKLITTLKSILDQTAYYKNEEIFDVLKKNMPSVTGFVPSNNNFDQLTAKYGKSVAAADFTSIAGYLTLLVGMPLAATGLYSEVQIHTFKFNKAAGFMKNQVISDAPIRVNDVFRHPDQEGSLAKNTSISNALSLLSNYLSNPKQAIYGISNQNQYDKIKVDVSTRPAKDPATEADKRAEQDEDEVDIPESFVTPNIRYIIRSVPAKVFPEGSNYKVSDYVIDPEKSIAQIIIYDANSSPNFDKIIGAYGYTQLKGKDGAKITPDIAKNVFKRAFPSIVYGSTNSVIKAINVSTDINNAISQQNIIDIGKDTYLGRSKSNSSSDVGEITLFPGSVTVTMIGLPIIERGQEVYLDLGTGTTLDALYYVTSVKHDFRPGDFTTSLTLTYKGQGSVMSLTTMLDRFNDTLPKDQKAPAVETPKESASTKTTDKSDKSKEPEMPESQKKLLEDLAKEASKRDKEYSKALNSFGR